MRNIRSRDAFFALAAAMTGACGAAAPDYLTTRKMTVPFDGMRPARDPNDPYRELHERLKRQAAADAGDSRFVPVVGMMPIGEGELNLLAAITPRRGVFYIVKAGPYRLGPGPTIITPRSDMDVCRFTVEWERLPGGAYAPGLIWAGDRLPDLKCNRPDGTKPSETIEWRRRSASASYAVEASGTEAGLKVDVVRETWPKWPGWPNAQPSQPLDGGRAVEAVARDRVVRAIPADPDDNIFFAETARGRSFVGMHMAFRGSDRSCIVEGLSWADLAVRLGARRTAARRLCERLLDQYRFVPRPGDPGPTMTVLKPVPGK